MCSMALCTSSVWENCETCKKVQEFNGNILPMLCNECVIERRYRRAVKEFERALDRKSWDV